MSATVEKNILQYAAATKEFSFASLAEKMHGNLGEIKTSLWGLVSKGKLENSVGFVFRVVENGSPKRRGRPKTKLEKFFPIVDEKEPLISFNRDKNPLAEELFAVPKDEEAKSKKVKKKAETELSFDALFDDDDEDDEQSIQRRKLHDAARSLKIGDRYEMDGNVCFYEMGVTYPDDSPVVFKMTDQDGLLLNDCGRTFAYLSKYYNLDSEAFLGQINRFAKEYSLGLTNEGALSEFSIRIRDKENAYVSFLWLFLAVEKLIDRTAGGLIREELSSFDKRCNGEMKLILAEKRLSRAQAMEIAKEKLEEAKSRADGYGQAVFETLIESMDVLTDDGFNVFKREVTDGE